MPDRQSSSSGYRPTEPEQRLLDYLRAGTLDAEIAVRMGVPVGDVKDRIASLIYKLGLHSRAELAAWRPDSTPPPPTEETPEDGEAAPPPAPTRSRRSLLASALGGAAAVAAGGAGLYWLSRPSSPGDNRTTPAPTAGATPSPSNSVPPTGIAAIVPAPDAFHRYGIKAGTPITADHGLFFMDTKGGDIEAWQLTDSLVQDYDVNPHNTYVLAHNRTRNLSYIADRRTGDTYSWPSEELFFVAASRTVLLFEEASTAATRLPGSGSGRYHLLNSNFDLLRSFTVDDPPDAGSTAVFSPDAADILLWRAAVVGTSNLPARVDVKVWHVDAASGLGEPIAGAVGTPARQPYLLVDGGEVFLLFTSNTHTKVMRVTWKGGLIFEANYPSTVFYPSPSGQHVAWEERLPLSGTSRGDSWPSVVVASIGGGSLPYRIRSASLTFGDNLASTRWLADSSGFVVQVRDESAPDGPAGVTYAIVRMVDGAVFPLPALPPGGRNWFTDRRVFGPAPAPEGPFISFGRIALLDRVMGTWLAQPSLPPRGPAQLAPWGVTADEMRFVLPSTGRSTPPIHVLLNAQRERTPEEYAFVVARTGDGLNLREAPDLGAEVLDLLRDGARLELAPIERFVGAVQFNQSGMWVHVRTAEGREGWVNAAYLDWA